MTGPFVSTQRLGEKTSVLAPGKLLMEKCHVTAFATKI